MAALCLPQESIFGAPRVFNEEKLPTKQDVIRRIFLAYEDNFVDKGRSEYLGMFISEIRDEIIAIWKKTPIPILTINGIDTKIKRLIEQYHRDSKHKMRHVYQQFVEECEKLFDIAQCKCDIGNCNCPTAGKIPKMYQDFIVDQRGERQLSISMLRTYVEVEPSRSWEPQFWESNFLEREARPSTSYSEYMPSSEQVTPHQTSREYSYNPHRHMPNLAMECDRYNVSSRVAAALVSAAFKDFDVKLEGQIVIIDKNKVARERIANRSNLLKHRRSDSAMIAFSFDSRKDETSTQFRMDDGKIHTRMVKQTHVTVLKQPNSLFLGYFTDTENESNELQAAEQTTQNLLEFFQTRNHDLTFLVGVCCDGERKNTGRLHGIVRNLEVSVDRPLHWFICLLHFNELPFKHLFQKIDASRTTGPRTTTGRIAKAIEADDLPVCLYLLTFIQI